MRKANQARCLALVISMLSGGPASALVGADIADRTVQRFTVVVAGAKGRCSGVVLAPDIVLTAAHCVRRGERFQIGGNFGGGYQAGLGPVAGIVQHPLYTSGDAGSPDLAILKLATPLPDRFVPAVLNPRVPGVGDDLIVAGYGKSAATDSGASVVLRMVLQRVSQSIRGWVVLTSVGEDAANAGPGDSGGPVFAYRGMHSLVGLMVGVSGKRTKAVALAAHTDWIRETMRKLSGP
ncbi:MAG: trypsin-like serine protease [Bradyrhizobium sp.]|uniref:S1 family peptidase n=1 Tax=Bradyrhizobium sp. TaxID=376 RepID=UPI002716CBCB|nr:trypsin-like serine protease [Bradyrhizobium sp.]MDO8399987.1 trypsin-like serine protease [Bradyrhizobium sp.]